MMSSLTRVGQTLQNRLEGSHDAGPLGSRSNLTSFDYKSTNYKEFLKNACFLPLLLPYGLRHNQGNTEECQKLP